MAEFKKIFERFASAEQLTADQQEENGDDDEGKDQKANAKAEAPSDSDEEGEGAKPHFRIVRIGNTNFLSSESSVCSDVVL
jgi:hypothetical protein